MTRLDIGVKPVNLRLLVLITSGLGGVVTLALLAATNQSPASTDFTRALLEWMRLITAMGACITASIIDIRERRIPNRLTLPTIAALVTSAAVESFWHGSFDAGVRVVLGAVVFAGVLFIVAWFGTLGIGDVKLGLVIGGAIFPLVGWMGLLTAGVLAYVAALPHALTVLIRRRLRHGTNRESPPSREETELPFGPYLVLGALAAVVLSTVSQVATRFDGA